MLRPVLNKLKLFVYHWALALLERKLQDHLAKSDRPDSNLDFINYAWEVISDELRNGALKGSSGETSRSKSVSSSTSSS